MKKLLIGCGVVAGVLLVGAIVSTVYLVSWFRSNAPDTDEMEARRAELVTRFGARGDYVPPLIGELGRDRIERFLSVREAGTPPRRRLGAQLDTLLTEAQGLEHGPGGFGPRAFRSLSLAREGMKLLRDGVGFMEAQTESLLAVGMGEGEYTFIFALAFFSYLEWDPVEAAEELARGPSGDVPMMDDIEEFRDEYRRLYLRQLRNLRRSLDTASDLTPGQIDTRDRVDAAIEERASGGFPFSGDVPPGWAAALEPFRDRLSATLPLNVGEIVVEAVETFQEQGGEGLGFSVESTTERTD